MTINPDNLSDSFVFYRSFRDAINLLPEDQQLKAYKPLVNYALDGEIDEINENLLF